MSELFDSLNLTTASAGPSSSQQSSSQPSTSKVFWHTSPSPGVLRSLANWTPNKPQDSPCLPLCTQAFVGELRKLPGALESPLVSRESAHKRKLHSSSRHVSDPTPNRRRNREYIDLELSDDEEEEESRGTTRLLLGDAGESSPESRRRRTIDAGHTGKLRDASPSEHSLSSKIANLDREANHGPKRQERRHPRRRKKESLMAGLGLMDEEGRTKDCLKLFEDLQAAIAMHASANPSSSGGGGGGGSGTETRMTFDNEESAATDRVGGRLTPREGINRTTSAPSSSRMVMSRDVITVRSSQPGETDGGEGGLQSRKGVFRPVKSDHDVFRAGGSKVQNDERAFQPKTNLPMEPQVAQEKEEIKPTSQQFKLSPVASVSLPQQPRQKEVADLEPAPARTNAHQSIDRKPIDRLPAPTSITTTTAAVASPIKRSARIEAMQTASSTSNKKLGVRAHSMLSKSTSASSPRKTSPADSTRKVTTPSSAVRTRTTPLPGMSQARQVGLPRSCSQYAPTQSQTVGGGGGGAGPAAPFRPPAISRANVVRAASPVKVTAATKGNGVGRIQQPSSSDDSFGDDDDAFLALACELEY